MKQNNSRLENRTQLVTLPHVRMGPKVFINCAGFIKIDTKELSDRYDLQLTILATLASILTVTVFENKTILNEQYN